MVRVGIRGEGPRLLLVNGIGASLEMWEPFATRFPDRQVVAFDFPGCGESDRIRRPTRMRGLATLTQKLLDRLGMYNADVLGYSWGGALAQQLVHQAPHRVRRLVLVSTVPGLGGKP